MNAQRAAGKLAIIAFWAVTLVACGEIAIRTSAMTGAIALIACFLCYWPAAGFAGCVISRRQKRFRPFDLVMFGVLDLLVIAVGVALMWWSQFSLSFFSLHITGVAWALLGTFFALVVVELRDWKSGNIEPWSGRRLPDQ